MNINISDIQDLSDDIKPLCVVLTAVWTIVATLKQIGWVYEHLHIDVESMLMLPVGIVSMLIASAILVGLSLLTSPLGGEPLHRCAIISVSILVGVPIILSIKDAIADRNRKKSVASAATVTVKSIKKEEIPGQLNMSKSQVRKIKNNQKRYKKHK